MFQMLDSLDNILKEQRRFNFSFLKRFAGFIFFVFKKLEKYIGEYINHKSSKSSTLINYLYNDEKILLFNIQVFVYTFWLSIFIFFIF